MDVTKELVTQSESMIFKIDRNELPLCRVFVVNAGQTTALGKDDWQIIFSRLESFLNSTGQLDQDHDQWQWITTTFDPYVIFQGQHLPDGGCRMRIGEDEHKTLKLRLDKADVADWRQSLKTWMATLKVELAAG